MVFGTYFARLEERARRMEEIDLSLTFMAPETRSVAPGSFGLSGLMSEGGRYEQEMDVVQELRTERTGLDSWGVRAYGLYLSFKDATFNSNETNTQERSAFFAF